MCLVAQSCLTLCNPLDVARQAPLSMGSSRQEYWSGLSFPSPRDLPNPRIKLTSLALTAGFFTIEPPEEAHIIALVGFKPPMSKFFKRI